MRGGGLRPEVWCDAGGDFALPITSSDHDLLIMLQRYAVFLYLQNLYLSTSKRCIKMGIPSLKSAILYCVSLFIPFSKIRCYRPGWQSNHANITNIPNSHPRKQPFSWTTRPFFRSHPRKQPFSWTEKDSPKLSYQEGGSWSMSRQSDKFEFGVRKI